MNENTQYSVAWLAMSILAAAIAMLYSSAAYVDGQWIPVGNDAFYHARRIIDTAISERGFYQFDTMMHVPEGSWINWPWAYDWLLAMALKLALLIRPEMQPMKFLAFVPVAWVFVNAALLTLICRELRLAPRLTGLGLLIFALLPLTQSLHGLGSIDHHFLEATFMLGTVFAGLKFFDAPGRNSAIALGSVLGVAVAFHNGLFILQIPVLAAIVLLWARKSSLPLMPMLWLATSVITMTTLVALPSATLHDMQFEFWTLSWFHVYIAFGSACVIAFVAIRPLTLLNAGLFAAGGIVLLLPLMAKIVAGGAFVSGDLDIIRNVHEVKSPLASLVQPGGLRYVTQLYGWLVFIAPLVIVWQLIRLVRDRDARETFFIVASLFGIALMLFQYRLHPFGTWALIAAGLLGADALFKRFDTTPFVSTALTLVAVAVILQPPLSRQIFVRVPPAANADYAASRAMFPVLGDACGERPGTALSYSDDGHPIRYHTDCSVVINNFLISPFHRDKLAEAATLRSLSAEEFLEQASHIRYVFVRMTGLFRRDAGGIVPTPLTDLQRGNDRLFVELTFRNDIPEAYRLLGELRVDDARDFAYVRVFEIVREQ